MTADPPGETAAYLGVLTGCHGLQCLGIPPGNCSVGSDTEEDGGSTPPAPTIPTLSGSFATHGSGGACEFKLAHAAPRRACPSGSPPTGACHCARDGPAQSRRTHPRPDPVDAW